MGKIALPPRRTSTKGFKRTDSLLSGQIRSASQSRGFAQSRLLTTGANAPMLQMQVEQIRTKVNAVYGYNAISRVRVTQTAPTGFAEGRVAFEHKKPEATPTPDPALRQKAAEAAGPVTDTTLRDALARLGENVLTKNKRHADALSTSKKG